MMPPSRDVRWPLSRLALAGGLLLSGLIAAALILLSWYQYREVRAAHVERGELLARVLQDHATRTVETAAVTLTALTEVVVGHGAPDDLSRLGPTLAQALVGQPFVRSIAVLDDDGRVLASSALDDVDERIDIRALGVWPAPGSEALGPVVRGRQLADIAVGRSASAAPVGFIPIVRRLPTRHGGAIALVALLNPDGFANYQQLALSPHGGEVVLALYDGRILSATGEAERMPPSVHAEHPVFRERLAAHEHGSYVGQGYGSDRRVVAYRASRSRPLVVVVEEPHAAVWQAWRTTMRWFLLVGLLSTAFVGAMSWSVWRSLRARELAQRRLDQAQADVAYRERELSILVKSVQELIFRTDVEGRLTFVNARWSAVSGTRPEEALGRPLRDIVDASQHATVDWLFARDTHDGVRNAQIPVKASDGSLRRFDVAVVPLRTRGSIVGYAGSALDVTERWHAQQQLQAQLALTGLLLEISPIPVSVNDAEGRIVSVNQAWEEFMGRTRREVVGLRALQVLPFETEPLHADVLKRLQNEGGRVRYQASLPHADGSHRDVVITKVLVPGEAGQARGVLCTVMDVSEFREAERATREARDVAEEASRSKSEFIANISHELRTPLQSILGFSELGMVRGREHERLAAMFKDIHASGERMLALVNDLLDVSKIESTVGTFHLERTDLRALVRSVTREIEPLLAKRHLRLELSLSEAPLVAKVDPLRFQQVVRNVLANSIKFSPEGQCIDLTGRATAGGEIQVSIRDHGPGIPPAEIESIFEAFVQSSTTKDGSGGTGLGLAICRKIVEAHGGRVYAENATGGGAIFHIMLPARGGSDTAPLPLEEIST